MPKKNKTQIKKIKEIYSSCFKEIKTLKKYIFIIIGLFFVSAVFGYFFDLGILQYSFLEQMLEIMERIKDLNFFQLFWLIFTNNSLISFFALLFGVFLGVLPLILTILNGLMLGFVSKLSVLETGLQGLWVLLPHGIFELTAVFIAFAIGLKLGFVFLLNLGETNEKTKRNFLLSIFKNGLKVFVFVVLPLLFIAALIETILIFYL